jgi:hypothetical protein
MPIRVWLLVVLSLGLTTAGAWGVITVLGVHASHDRPELIDDPPVITALETPCAALQAAAARVDAAAPVPVRAAQLAGVVVAIDDLASSVRALPAETLDGDNPARYWAADWETLGSRLTDYSVALTSGAPAELDTPLTQDGYTIVTRMDVAAPPGCEVPRVLVSLDPTPPPAPSTERRGGAES